MGSWFHEESREMLPCAVVAEMWAVIGGLQLCAQMGLTVEVVFLQRSTLESRSNWNMSMSLLLCITRSLSLSVHSTGSRTLSQATSKDLTVLAAVLH
ncbi:hypothetical protein Syun_029638 [Stephania yunnanensis]|uniref:Uncharacterized protein n=1 Tax=Stephania yunnanensis TaxID=152371 RepID=A0AAP0E5Y2_9MAGN